jgi:Type IV secretion-system coupling protein DNA-binding domain
MQLKHAVSVVIRVLEIGPWLLVVPTLALAQASPFMTGATALQTNILSWLTPIAIILVIAQVSSTYGAGEGQTLVENCGNTLILRCSSSEHGGTSQFASRLIGEREVIRWQTSRASDRERWFPSRGSRRSTSVSRQHVTEAAVLSSELEQLPDLTGYLKTAAFPVWLHVRFDRGR